MRYVKFVVFSVIPLFVIVSCTKEPVRPGSSSLTIINAVVGSSPLVTNFSGGYSLSNYYMNATMLNYGVYSASVNEFGSYLGSTHLALYQYPDTTAHSMPLFDLILTLPVNTIHSLYLTGTISKPDTLFTTDTPPYHSFSDSTIGFRFVNLSVGANPVSVNIKGQPYGSEVSILPYKGITSFKNYAATAAIKSYVFEIRDAGNGTLISSYTVNGVNNGSGSNTATNSYRFRNFTIALKGIPGGIGSSAQGVFLSNNY